MFSELDTKMGQCGTAIYCMQSEKAEMLLFKCYNLKFSANFHCSHYGHDGVVVVSTAPYSIQN